MASSSGSAVPAQAARPKQEIALGFGRVSYMENKSTPSLSAAFEGVLKRRAAVFPAKAFCAEPVLKFVPN